MLTVPIASCLHEILEDQESGVVSLVAEERSKLHWIKSSRVQVEALHSRE